MNRISAMVNKMEIIRPTRREFIKGAAALAAYSALPKGAEALLGSGGTLRHKAPKPAVQHGFNTNTFFDDFTSLSTIDINNTLNPGYKWYVTLFNSLVGGPSNLSISNSILTFTPNSSGLWISTTGHYGTPATKTVGTAIAQTGGYFECKMAFSPTNSGRSTSGPYWPAWWIDSIERENNLSSGSTSGYPLPELDCYEYEPGWGSLGTVHQWNNNSSGPQNTNNALSLGSPTYTNFNRYGFLWLPQARNGGTGLFEWYFNGIPVSTVTHSSSTTSPECPTGGTGVFSSAETNGTGLQLMIGSGAGWPIQVDYVTAWQ